MEFPEWNFPVWIQPIIWIVFGVGLASSVNALLLWWLSSRTASIEASSDRLRERVYRLEWMLGEMTNGRQGMPGTQRPSDEFMLPGQELRETGLERDRWNV